MADTLRTPRPASREVTPTAEGATLDGARALVTRLSALPETDEVGGGVEWMERFAHGQRLLWLFALGVGAVLAVGAVLTGATAPTLGVHARRGGEEDIRARGGPPL